MARAIPYRFCRYQIALEDEVLDGVGQAKFFEDIQGQMHEGAARGDRVPPSILLIEPRKLNVDGERCLSWFLGRRQNFRVKQGYDPQRRILTKNFEVDSHIKTAHCVAVPDLGLLAVSDQSGEENVGAVSALSGLKAVLKSNRGEFDAIHIGDDEAEAALQNWSLTQYDYTVRTLNPITPKDLAQRRSDAMKDENVLQERGTLLPEPGKGMRPNGGVIEETSALVSHGYGQYGFKGITEGGHVGQVKKPKFHTDKKKNLKERQKPRFLRVLFDANHEEDISEVVASALMEFYNNVE